MKLFKYLFLLFSIFILITCSGVKPLSKEKQFSSSFKEQILLVKKEVSENRLDRARKMLIDLSDSNLQPIEKAEKYNVLGLIDFSEKKYKKARGNFVRALSFDFNQPEMVNQISLNMASVEYKLGREKESLDQLDSIDVSYLEERDRKKVFLLRYILAKKLGLESEKYDALISLLAPVENKKDLIGNRYYKILAHNFFKLEKDNQFRLLNVFKSNHPSTVVAHLAYNLSLKFYREGDQVAGSKLQEWVKSNFSDYYGDFAVTKVEYDVAEEIDSKKIGVILPLSGDKGSFGLRTLDGITLALRKIGDPFKLIVKDSKNSPNAAAQFVKDLVFKDKVAVVIGGLFNQTAEREYEEAAKYGVAYIALSPVYIDRTKKTSLLVELPGSVESQVSAALSGKVAKALGRRLALFYPENQIGRTYLNEFWRQVDEKQFELVTAGSFSQSTTDFRDPISNLVGLKFERERQEEYEVWESIYKAKYDNTKRIQVLNPVVDFDWVFVPSFPHQAVQIIPSFQYLGVKSIPFVGGPSWRSRTIVSRKKMLGDIYFVGDLIPEKKENFQKMYYLEYKKQPKLLETLGFDAIYLTKSLLSGRSWDNRSDLIESISNKSVLPSYLSIWKKESNTWIKDMDVTKVTSSGMKKVR